MDIQAELNWLRAELAERDGGWPATTHNRWGDGCGQCGLLAIILNALVDGDMRPLSRADRLRILSALVDRELTSSRELSARQAMFLIDWFLEPGSRPEEGRYRAQAQIVVTTIAREKVADGRPTKAA